MSNTSLYIPDEKKPVINRAKKLAAFHLDKSLSVLFIEMCETIINNYEKEEL